MSLKIFIRESLFYVRKLGIKSYRQNSSKDTWSHTRNRETKKIHRKELCKKCALQERNPCVPRFEERTQDEILHRERWDLARSVYRLEKSGQSCVDGQCQHPLRKSQRSENSRSIPPRILRRWSRPTGRCKQTRKHKCTFTTLISS